MANLNKVMFIGRLTRDPETRTFQSGGKVAAFGFAVNNRRKNQQSGEWEDEPVFLDCEAFNRGKEGTMADRVGDTLRKGMQIFIEGHLKLDRWKDKNSGEQRQRLKVVVDNFQYLEKKEDGDRQGGQGGYTQQQGRGQRTQQGQGGRPPQQDPGGYDGGGDYPPAGGGDDEDIPF